MAVKRTVELKTITNLITAAVFLIATATVVFSGFYVYGVIDRMTKPAEQGSSVSLRIEKPDTDLLQAIYGNMTAKPARPARDFSKVRDAFNMLTVPVPPPPVIPPAPAATTDGTTTP